MKQVRTTNRKTGGFVEQLTPFKASNLEGRLERGCYVVYSYDWYPVLAYSFVTMKWYRNSEGYRPSTKRQMLYCTPINYYEKLNHVQLNSLIEEHNSIIIKGAI